MISIVLEQEASQSDEVIPKEVTQPPVSATSAETDRIFTQAATLNQQFAIDQSERDAEEEANQSAQQQEQEEAQVAEQVAKRKSTARIAARVEEELLTDPETPKLQAAQKVFSKANSDKVEQLTQAAAPEQTPPANSKSDHPKPVQEMQNYI